MTNYLPDGSSEYCVCGHSAKDHQIRHVEGKNTFERYKEDGRQVTICKDWNGYRVFCWGKNIGGINCMTESEKRSAQKVDPFLYNTIECMCEQFRPHKRRDGKEPTYSCSSYDRITKSCQFPYITEDFTICSRCCEEDKARKLNS